MERSSDFSKLVEGGVFSLVRTKKTPYGLRTGPYVGSAIIDASIYLNVEEKEAGSVAGLLNWSMPDGFRDINAPSPGGHESQPLLVFAINLTDALSNYLRAGRVRKYVSSRFVSIKPRGRIDLRASLALRARGRAPELVSCSNDLSADILPNQFLALALSRASRLLMASDYRDHAMKAQQFSDLFSDVDPEPIVRMAGHELKAAFDETLQEYGSSSDLIRALRFSQPFVFDGGLGLLDSSYTLPRTYFLNLEVLFEHAVRNVLQEILKATVSSATKGSELGRKIFGKESQGFTADPDVVIHHGRLAQLVMDCKYKSLDLRPEHSDVYQVTAHATAFECSSAALIYPGSDYTCRPIGRTQNEISLEAITVRPGALVQDLGEFVAHRIFPTKANQLTL